MSTARFARIAAAAVLAACRPSAAPSPDAEPVVRTYVLLLGTDTLAVDQFTVSRMRVDGTIVTHEPRTVVTRYTVTLEPSTGRATRLQYTTRLPDGGLVAAANLSPIRQVTIDFAGDSALARIQRDTVATVRVAARNAFPYITYGMAFFQLPVSALRASGADSASYAIYSGGRAVTPVVVRRTGADRYVVSIAGFGYAVTTSDAGVIQQVDGRGTTQQFVATLRDAGTAPDLAALATAWAAAQQDRRLATSLSIRDTTRANVGQAEIWIDYGRPLTRGRQVWGSAGVLNDTLWRTGANAATQFRTSAPLTMGGQQVPAGTYTLWTLAVPGRYQLIINRQTGQWGTQYDPARDLARVPAEVRRLSPAVERFTIAVEPTGANAGVIRLQWGTQELTVPFTTPR